MAEVHKALRVGISDCMTEIQEGTALLIFSAWGLEGIERGSHPVFCWNRRQDGYANP